MRSISATPARLLNAAVVVAVVAVFVVGASSPVGAHTDFDSSSPADGASVDTPVSEITVAFTLPVTLVGDGFEVLDPQLNLVVPVAVTTDDTVFRLQFDPSLAGGDVGVRYAVTAEDGHVLEGSFSFTVNAELAPPATPTTVIRDPDPPASQPPATQPSATQPPATQPPATSVVATTQPASAESTTAVPTTVATDDSDGSSSTGVVIAIAVVVAVAAAGYAMVRRRRSST